MVCVLGTYKIGKFKSAQVENTPHPLTQEDAVLTLISSLPSSVVMQSAKQGLATAETQMSIMDLVNAPSNKKTPQVMAQWAVQSAEKHGFKATIWEKAAIEAAGMGALLAVNRGSEHPPHLIVLEYLGQSPVVKVGLVGKGITFDTGGLSIKSSEGMYYMKSDMGGAGAVLGAIELVAKLNLPLHLITVVPATDNLVDALSFRPSDVIVAHNGKTIEIVDTDAEGRLVLADALSYIVKEFQPEVLIDLATLTGSTVRTLGYHAAALFTNNEALHDALVRAGEKTGEKVWRFPLWQEYEEDLKSDVADLKNFSGKPTAGAISAAKFLEAFIEQHTNWAHLDIAGMAFSDTEFSNQKSATAYGIRLLVNYLQHLCQQ
ncbi:MAG: leucyl aminopeptidase family protein [Saprospiraceae bacterium]|nr:leucyl aminopeptidase family protein [Saprospiraceae bacterium]